jgi:hypothetical protein
MMLTIIIKMFQARHIMKLVIIKIVMYIKIIIGNQISMTINIMSRIKCIGKWFNCIWEVRDIYEFSEE